MVKRSKVIGVGHYVPPRVVTNDELGAVINSSDEWIYPRTGIKERHYVDEGVGASDLGKEAAEQALSDAGLKASDLDFIIFASLSPDYTFPGSACILQPKLGLSKIGVMDIRNQCTGFIYSVATADAFIRTGQCKCVLVVGAETHSTGIEFSERGRNVTSLFGDAGAAFIMAPSEAEDRGFLSFHLHADGQYAKELWVECGGSVYHPRITHEMIDEGRVWPKMNGKLVFREAVSRLPEVIGEALEENDLKLDDIDLFIFHQANQRINEFVADRMGIPDEKMYHNIVKYGNTTAASMPLAFNEARLAGMVKEGDLVCFAALGAGMTWASMLMRW